MSIPAFENSLFFQNISLQNLFIIINTIVIMPILEEFLYRGLVMKKLLIKTNYKVAILVSSILFGLGHLDFEKSLVTFFSGLIIGYVFWKSKNLFYPIIIHIVINLLFSFFKYNSVEITFNLMSIYIIIYTISIYVLIFKIPKILKNEN
ncbi:lysostaphin resistance A-like protein [Mesonia sp. HuA40]|uniref:CPBP family intramembrane glutamic endopeptidase n=1 Tax=Mesonia sp. HuA40 TaxID=2602761 RepID=UPI00351A87C5